jgi:hypothetical protein
MTEQQIARVAHELNKAYCESIGDTSQVDWDEAPEWQKRSAVLGVVFHLDNPDATPEASHTSWLQVKTEEGWKYGPVKNAETKEHPCFCAYSELPEAQRAKDYIFRQTVHSLRGFLPKAQTTKVPTRGQEVMSVTFNPGSREDVAAIKQVFADAYDEIDRQIGAVDVRQDVWRLVAIAKTHLETAQMYAVKAVTRCVSL